MRVSLAMFCASACLLIPTCLSAAEQKPDAPVLSAPEQGMLFRAQTPEICWTGGGHDAFQVRVCAKSAPETGIAWDSGEVSGSADSCYTASLKTGTYYAFARLRNAAGWGPWSKAGPAFRVDSSIRIIPEPQVLVWLGNVERRASSVVRSPSSVASDGFKVNARTKIVVNSGDDEKDQFTAQQLRRKVWDTTGFLPEIVASQAGAKTQTENVIAIGDIAKNPAVEALVSSLPEAAGKEPKNEGYILGVTGKAIIIRGFDQAGTFYGCQTLIQLLEQFRKKPIDGLFCYDYPDMPWRGMFVRIKYNFDPEFGREIISECMARYKMNFIEVFASYGMAFESHPELYRVDDPAPKWKVINFANCAKQHFMEIIPGGVGWTKSDQWITRDGANPDLTEDPTKADQNLCPRNPKAQKLVADLRNEVIDMFKPAYMQIGGLSEIGVISSPTCKYCKGTDPLASFTEFLQTDRNFMVSKGIRPVMWSDMLRDDMPAGKSFKTWQCVGAVAKDIIIQDWEYTTDTDYPSLKTWNDNGLTSVGAAYGFGAYGYIGIENIYNWGVTAKNYGVQGCIAFNKFGPGYKESTMDDNLQMLNLACFPFQGEWTWTVGRPYWKPAPYDGQLDTKTRIAPDRPRGLSASAAKGLVTLKWTNASDSKLKGTWICYRTDAFPVDPTDGTFVCDKSGEANSRQSFIQQKAPAGTIYYSAFSHDGVRRFSAAAHTVIDTREE